MSLKINKVTEPIHPTVDQFVKQEMKRRFGTNVTLTQVRQIITLGHEWSMRTLELNGVVSQEDYEKYLESSGNGAGDHAGAAGADAGSTGAALGAGPAHPTDSGGGSTGEGDAAASDGDLPF